RPRRRAASARPTRRREMDPELRELSPQPAVTEVAVTDADGIPSVVDSGFPRLFGRLAELGVEPAGPPYIRYLRTGAELELELGCASYLIGDEDAGVAAVVDPRFEVDEYLELARYMGVSIEHVLETHNHADHVSGHGRLAAATGATIHIHRLAEPDYEHEPFDDGWELELGALRVRALHTPGHRP